MPDSRALQPLPWRRHLNGFVIAGVLTTLLIPVGSALAAYEGAPLFNLLSLGAGIVAFLILVIGLRIGPTGDDRRGAQHGRAAHAVVERAVPIRVTKRQRGRQPSAARLVRLDLRVEAADERTTRVRLRRWVNVGGLDRLEPGVVLPAKVLPGCPQDPALGLQR